MGYLLPLLLVGLACCVTPATAFGAGNIASISKIEGSNWRHGDIEDTLLQLMAAAAVSRGRRRKFTSMDVKRVYFGNWLRDYSQAIDTGSLKYVEGPTIRILLWILGFMTFGYATAEFEVTADRLGCYRPEEHIDNPKDYNDNNDAREYDRRLRGPVDERAELAIDPQTGLKNYIANERVGRLANGEPMTTSAALLRRLFGGSIELGRRYARDHHERDLFEAFRLMGTGLHCLEDFSAHSNYCELALIELGEQNVFPHVGARTTETIHGRRVWPVVTGTFGGVDFLHSVLGEFSDKTMQSEVQQLETTFTDAQNSAGGQESIIKDLLSKLNLGGGGDDISAKADDLKAKSAAQKEASRNSPWGLGAGANDVARDIYPFLEFHDTLMKKINEALETIGIEAIIEKLSEAVSLFVFSLLAPFILPIIKQVSVELKTGSSEVIASSQAAQLIVFNDENSSNPTHSMLSKDHFTNLLNEPAGKVASAVLKFVVPMLMAAWDDESINPNSVCDTIIGSVFHHPAFRNGEDGRPGADGRRAMFAVVEEWWNSKDEGERNELRSNLSRDGVLAGRNHIAGAHDSGHGCGKPLQRSKPGNKGGDGLGGTVGEAVGGALESALSGGGKKDTGGIGTMIGGMLGGALSGGIFGGGHGSDHGSGHGGGESRPEPYRTETHSSGYRDETGTSTSYRQEPSSYYSSGGGHYGHHQQQQQQQPQRTAYETRESYTESGPGYNRTTERYGGLGREPEVRSYESRSGEYVPAHRGEYVPADRGEYVPADRGEYAPADRGDDGFLASIMREVAIEGRGSGTRQEGYASRDEGYGRREEFSSREEYGDEYGSARDNRGDHHPSHPTPTKHYGRSDDKNKDTDWKEEKKKKKNKKKEESGGRHYGGGGYGYKEKKQGKYEDDDDDDDDDDEYKGKDRKEKMSGDDDDDEYNRKKDKKKDKKEKKYGHGDDDDDDDDDDDGDWKHKKKSYDSGGEKGSHHQKKYGSGDDGSDDGRGYKREKKKEKSYGRYD